MKVYYKAAENDDDAKSLFNSRKDYRAVYMYKTDDSDSRKSIRHVDVVSDLPLYGKVDFKGYPVYVLPENSMDAIVSEEIIHCVNFVKDAFDAFRDYYNNLYERGMMGDVGPMSTIMPTAAYVSPFVAFERNLTELKDAFLRDIAYPDPNSIVDVKDFMKKLASFLLTQSRDFPVTFSGYTLSPKCPTRSTGLVVELMDLPKSSDRVKVEMISSPSFNKYVAIATKYGFRVNINAPWTLIADIGSPRLIEYMTPYGLEDPNNYFKEYCVPTYNEDIKRIKSLFYDTYYEFITTVTVRKITPKCPSGISSSKAAYFDKRPQHRPDELEEMFSETYWLDFYMSARYNELNLNATVDTELGEIKKKIMLTYDRRGMLPALTYACKYFDEMNINVYKLANTPTLYDLTKSRYLSDDELKFNEDQEYQFRATEEWMEDQDWQIWQSGED